MAALAGSGRGLTMVGFSVWFQKRNSASIVENENKSSFPRAWFSMSTDPALTREHTQLTTGHAMAPSAHGWLVLVLRFLFDRALIDAPISNLLTFSPQLLSSAFGLPQ